MKTIILLNNVQSTLPNHYNNTARGMLPIVDKPQAAYLVDSLIQKGIKELVFAVTQRTYKNAMNLGDGTYWGATFDILECDNKQKVETFFDRNGYQHEFWNDDLLPDDKGSFITQSLSEAFQALRTEASELSETNTGNNQQVQSLDKYLQTNMHVLNHPNDYLISGFSNDNKIFTNEGSDYSTVDGDHVFIGQYAHINPKARLENNVIVGKHSIIGASTILNNTLILPGTRVAANLNLANCVVSSNWIYNTRTQGLAMIDDKNLLCTA